ncbi:hypothetical protein FA15DRAFT_107944 [Coprinopsis marcescibilis]|uniref:Uncharacterized protein n=1 Tax=Coprinopsis marcescibilis TaxID=230819 RepID=A0A5C3L659_COPMA|nr:hypothetical protein FA15DRAFT_107944 [Coprinopsis marcescibilis]
MLFFSKALSPYALGQLLMLSSVVLGLVRACPENEVVQLVETFIGKDRNVKVEQYACSGAVEAPKFQARQVNETNVCGSSCVTHCFPPAGGGPLAGECNVIADALRYESQNTGALFRIGTGVNATITMTYRSCKTFFVNQDFNGLIYCRTEWAALVDWLSTGCGAAQNAHGGLCVASNQLWFVQ